MTPGLHFPLCTSKTCAFSPQSHHSPIFHSPLFSSSRGVWKRSRAFSLSTCFAFFHFSLSCIFTLSFLIFFFSFVSVTTFFSLFLSYSASLYSFIFWFMVKFFHLHKKVLGFMIFPKTKSLIFFRCSPFILFFEFSQIFFYIPSSHIFICAYLSYYIHAN